MCSSSKRYLDLRKQWRSTSNLLRFGVLSLFLKRTSTRPSCISIFYGEMQTLCIYSDAVEAGFFKNIKRLMLSMPIFLGFCKSVSAWFRFSKFRHFVIGLPAARPRVSQWSKPSKSLHRVQHNDASRHPVAYGTAVHSVTVD